MLGVYRQTKSETIAIDQVLEENLVSENHSIKLLLHFNA